MCAVELVCRLEWKYVMGAGEWNYTYESSDVVFLCRSINPQAVQLKLREAYMHCCCRFWLLLGALCIQEHNGILGREESRCE